MMKKVLARFMAVAATQLPLRFFLEACWQRHPLP